MAYICKSSRMKSEAGSWIGGYMKYLNQIIIVYCETWDQYFSSFRPLSKTTANNLHHLSQLWMRKLRSFPTTSLGFPGGSVVKNTVACQYRRPRFNPCVRKIPWRMKWQPTPVFLPGKSHGQQRLASYSPWGNKRIGHDLAIKQQWIT